MRKILLLVLIIYNTNTLAQAIKYRKHWPSDVSDNCYMQGRVFIHLQYGVPNTLKKNWRENEKFGDYTTQNNGPLNIALEFALAKKTSLFIIAQAMQGTASWSRAFIDSNGAAVNKNYGFAYNNIGVGLGAANHIFYNKKVDLYVKAQATYMQVQFLPIMNKGVNSTLEAPAAIPNINYFGGLGFRYFIKKKLGINVDAGLANTHIVQGGFTYRFGL